MRSTASVGLRPAGDVGLVRDDDELEAGLAQTAAGLLDAGEQLDLVHVAGRARDAVAHDRGVEHAVAVEEDCAPSSRQTRPARASSSRACIDVLQRLARRARGCSSRARESGRC